MIRNAVLASALAGCATLASGQEFSLTLVPSSFTLECIDGSLTVSVYGDADVGTHILGGAFGLDVSDGAPFITGITWNPAAWSQFNTDGGYAGSGVHNQVIFGQLVIPGIFPPAAGSELGSLIGSFEITYAQPGPVLMDLNLIAGVPFSLETVDAVTGQTFRNDSGNLTINNATVLICPSPSGCAAFAVLGVFSTRRRR
ncbi:MAG: hypothetical protein KDA29_02190 [Phycisphaerales bacterium]|nr:hypothetical protein [Phycisphaerales bacterium]